jgi:hypothetical protein
VFDWLRRNGVQKIIKIMVIDDGNVSHSDAKIEEALSGFEVEIWDWKKLDINPDVICNSTSEVEEISLYSTGNNAVLMGWASPQGLLHKGKFSHVSDPSESYSLIRATLMSSWQLKMVKLFVREVDRTKEYPCTLRPLRLIICRIKKSMTVS